MYTFNTNKSVVKGIYLTNAFTVCSLFAVYSQQAMRNWDD